jgi:hypothetical protein
MAEPTIGHNIGRMPTVDIEALREILAGGHEELLKRRDELIAGSARVPETIEDQETAQKLTDYIRQINAAMKAAESSRVGVKEPFMAAERAVDGFFKQISDPLETLHKRMRARLTAYQVEVERRERELRAEALRQAREAERIAREEREAHEAAIRDEATLKAAIDADARAKRAAEERAAADKAAAEKAASMTRVRGDFGAVGSLRTYMTFRDLDRTTLDLEALREHIPLDCLERAVRSFVKAGGRELQGVTIYEAKDAAVR